MPVKFKDPNNERSEPLNAAHINHDHGHSELTGVGPDQHHDEDHAARHTEGGADEIVVTEGQIDSDTATDGMVLTADGAGNSAFEAASAHGGHVSGGDSHTHEEADITDLDHYDDTDANAAIDARVDKTFVDALNVDADTLDGEHASAFADASHNHTESDITDLDHWDATDTQGVIDSYVDATFINALDLDLDETDLDASVNASLDLADSSVQPGDDADTLGSGAATNGQVLPA